MTQPGGDPLPPIRLPDGREVQRPVSPPVGGGNFSIDFANAPLAIKELEQARTELLDIRIQAASLSNIQTPSRDAVSLDAAKILSLAAEGAPGSLVQAMDDGIEKLTTMIEALRSGFAGYEGTEGDVAARFS